MGSILRDTSIICEIYILKTKTSRFVAGYDSEGKKFFKLIINQKT
jgi:hypothetical protein